MYASRRLSGDQLKGRPPKYNRTSDATTRVLPSRRSKRTISNSTCGEPTLSNRFGALNATWEPSGDSLYRPMPSPDGSQVAFSAPKRFERVGSQQILFDIVLFDRREGKTRVVA